MASRLERRIEALEERSRARGRAVIVVAQNPDGTWPPDPPESARARLVVHLRRQGILPDSDTDELP